MSFKNLRLILGDQLNYEHSWFEKIHPETLYVMMEIGQELHYVTHHIQKIAGFFMAMRNFQVEKISEGHSFQYIPLNDSENTQNLSLNIKNILLKDSFSRFEYQLPDEYRLDQELKALCQELETHYGIQTQSFDTEHFFTGREYLGNQMKGRKSFLMETFYRQMRIQNQVLMSGSEPEGGVWNLDKENRKPYDFKTPIPPFKNFNHDASPILKILQNAEYPSIGTIEGNVLPWPISRKEALEVLEYFTGFILPHFGKFEDAMVESEPNLFHSRLSFAMNLKLISPREVIESCLKAYTSDSEKYPLTSVEGFIRQILGWREFMRGQYWAKMPEFSTMNFLGHSRKLPSWFWTGNTQMNCLHHCISDSLKNGYAHHIQRLMVTGNFALLSGMDPNEVDAWYLGIYVDAIEWVEITNTRGMSQWADGGMIASKPYVSSANYISKMSNYCQNCIYNAKIRYGEKACPFNSLYWNFFLIHESKLKKNIRLSLVYKNLERMESSELNQIKQQANLYLSQIESI